MKIFKENNVKGSTIVLSILTLIAISVVVFIYHDDEVNLGRLSMLKPKAGNAAPHYVKCQLFSNFGANNYLMLEMAIPYRDKEQQSDLKGKMERIKSDFLTNVNHRKLGKWIQERDYDALKAELLKVINAHTKEPVEHIYFDSLLYQ
jgi:flagellar basal body-associated protein FliL